MEEKKIVPAFNQEYTVAELLEELQNDPSWQPDAERRKAIVAKLRGRLLADA